MSWFSTLFQRRVRERKLDLELRFHLEEQIRENIAGGMDPVEARRQAAIEFGGLEQTKEECREVQSGRWLEATVQDLKFGLRTLRRTPAFTIAALLILAIGIGANTAIFSFVDGVLLKPVPYPEAERIMVLNEKAPNGNWTGISTLTYLDWLQQNTVFENVAAMRMDEVALTGDKNAVRLLDEQVSAKFFDIFRIAPALGRTFVGGEDQPGQDGVTILTNKLWKSRFGTDPNIIGRTINLNGKPSTVVGVMPPGILDRSWPDMYRPLTLAGEKSSRDYHWLYAFAMLKQGVTIEQAHTQLNAIAARIAQDFPQSNKGWGAEIISYTTTLVANELRQSLYVLMAAVAMVLLIACANLANLMLARGVGREREVAVRAALGAGRWRIVRQFFTESLLLSFAGGGLGLLVGFGGIAVLKMAPPGGSLPPTAIISLDGRVLIFTLGVSVLTGIIFGLIPAIKASRPDLTHPMKSSSLGASSGRAFRRLRDALIIIEVAMAFILLSGAGLLIRSFFQLQKVETGFDSSNLATAYLPIANQRFASGEELTLYLHEIVDHLNSLPGVSDVALTTAPPINWGWGFDLPFQVLGTKTIDAADRPYCGFKRVTSLYFRTLGMRLTQGRLLNEHDVKGTQPVTVISESMAKKYFPDKTPLGQHILINEVAFASTKLGPEIPWEVIGVVADEKNGGLRDDNYPRMYVTVDQSPTTWQFLVVRGAINPAVLARSMRKALREIDPGQVLDGVVTLNQVKSDSMSSDRRRSCLLAIFAAAALALAGTGLYGMISYSVAQRTREIGIRTALGASSMNVLGLVLRSGMRLTGIGLVLGIGGAIGLSQILASLLFNVGKYDPTTLATVGGILAVTALLACYFPARRAANLNPISALRCE